MGAKPSHQTEHETNSFDRIPDELKLSIFTLLPYKDVVNCMLLNKKYHALLLSKWTEMRKIALDHLEFSTSYKRCFIKFPYNMIRIKPNKSYAPHNSPCENILPFFDSRRQLNRMMLKTFMNLSFIQYLRNYKPYFIRSMSINSIEDGVQQCLDFILSKANFRYVLVSGHDNSKVYQSKLMPILKNSFIKHGTKIQILELRRMEINCSTVHMINSIGLYRLQLISCSFENEETLSQISNTSQIDISIHTKDSACPVKVFQLLLEKWINGHLSVLTAVNLFMLQEMGEKLYNEVVANLFKSITNKSEKLEKPGQSHEMISVRKDGLRIRLSYDDDTRKTFKYFFRSN